MYWLVLTEIRWLPAVAVALQAVRAPSNFFGVNRRVVWFCLHVGTVSLFFGSERVNYEYAVSSPPGLNYEYTGVELRVPGLNYEYSRGWITSMRFRRSAYEFYEAGNVMATYQVWYMHFQGNKAKRFHILIKFTFCGFACTLRAYDYSFG